MNGTETKQLETSANLMTWQPEYDFDYGEARSNRFAEQMDRDQLVVILDPDIAKVFTSSESVNKVLRALMSTMPKAG